MYLSLKMLLETLEVSKNRKLLYFLLVWNYKLIISKIINFLFFTNLKL